MEGPVKKTMLVYNVWMPHMYNYTISTVDLFMTVHLNYYFHYFID